MKRFKAESGERKAERRRATTLAEVLVSIMILSIGLISLATLFPISILRSLQATQLTNAAILSVNAETQIDISPRMVFIPDGHDPTVLSHLLEHFRNSNTRNYIIDPLGWNLATSGKNVFGTKRANADILPRYPGLPRFDAATVGINQTTATANALRAVTLPDSWVDQDVSGPGTWVPTTTTGTPPNQIQITGFTFDEGDLSAVAYGGAVQSRIVLFDTTGKKSRVRPIFNIVGRTVTWKGSDNFTVGIARIETQEPRYTWLLTVRQSPSGRRAQVDVVVIFRRPDPSPVGEKHYQAVFTGPTTRRVNGRDVKVPGKRAATITFTAADDPALKKGGYILDATNAHWYRIQKITNKTTTGATLRLDRPAIRNGQAAVVVEGVIEVFPLGSKDNTPLLDLLDKLN